MRMAFVLVCVLIAAAAVPLAQGEPPVAGGACVFCGKALGRDVPESALSSDPDFKQHGMFQTCQACMDKKMDRQTQNAYIQVAQKYKWNSISHNKSIAFRYNHRGKM